MSWEERAIIHLKWMHETKKRSCEIKRGQQESIKRQDFPCTRLSEQANARCFCHLNLRSFEHGHHYTFFSFLSLSFSSSLLCIITNPIQSSQRLGRRKVFRLLLLVQEGLSVYTSYKEVSYLLNAENRAFPTFSSFRSCHGLTSEPFGFFPLHASYYRKIAGISDKYSR